jgi:ribonucleoside-diphosphate reductase beta chain
MSLLTPRAFYRPFEYQKAYDFYRAAQSVHWTKDEIKIAEDLQNWKYDLTETEKKVIGGILKGFTQMEIMVGDYWRRVPDWFPKPEIAMMASTMSYFEAIHTDNYAMINEELGLDDFTSFLYDPDTKAKIDYFVDAPNNNEETTLEQKALSLAVFSAFAEGCMLFSSFAVLLSFQKENLMKGVSQIVSFSVRDENLHSMAGCWLFNTLCEENPGLRERIAEQVRLAANTVYQLEKSFIDNLFADEAIRTLNPFELKQFIKHRINMKLQEIGYEPMFRNIDKASLESMSWFDKLASGREFGDFFAVRVSEYTQVSFTSDQLF